jgi:cold shock CspA family protein
MRLPVQITFRNMGRDRAVETIVRRRAAGLEKFFPRLMGCRVIVEAPHRRHRSGNLYHVRVDATVPGKELVVKRDPRLRGSHGDLRVAIRDAFDAARRELMDEVRLRRGQVKAHAGTTYGRVVWLDAGKGYGFLLDEEGREIYFHAHSVLDGFERLRIGARVRFTEERGDEGPQASTVVIAGKRHRGPLRPHV